MWSKAGEFNATQQLAGGPCAAVVILVPDSAQESITSKTLHPLCSNKIIQPDVAQSLRLAATLVNGVVIVFNKQTTVLIGEQCSLSLSHSLRAQPHSTCLHTIEWLQGSSTLSFGAAQ